MMLLLSHVSFRHHHLWIDPPHRLAIHKGQRILCHLRVEIPSSLPENAEGGRPHLGSEMRDVGCGRERVSRAKPWALR